MIGQEVVRVGLSNNKDHQSIEHISAGEGNAISQLVELMRSVDMNSPEAKLNATTISDGKGGRILL